MSYNFDKISDYEWKIDKTESKGMNAPVIVYATNQLLNKMKQDRTLSQGINVAKLPGVVNNVSILPDGHEGYGFPIGGVAAFDAEEGIVSPGGVGYDINCGVRLLNTNLSEKDVKPKIKEIVSEFFKNVPSGVGSKGAKSFSANEMDDILSWGSKYIVEKGFGWKEDYLFTEEEGSMENADHRKVSHRAKKRGAHQLGSLGSGNHFLELNLVDEIHHPEAAKVFNIEKGSVCILIHTGSRGLGYQVCSDSLQVLDKYAYKNRINLPDRELSYAKMDSQEANDYMKTMGSAINYAWANRQMITYQVRKSMKNVFNKDADQLGLNVVYDVAHNIAKKEEHIVDKIKRKLIVHRKGATRCFPAGHTEIPEKYKNVGQPVFIPGTMGTASWILIGTNVAMEKTFGSTAHGAGRVLSRSKALRNLDGNAILANLEKKGIQIKVTNKRLFAEEAPESYKDVDEVVKTSHESEIAKKVARLIPLGVAKG